MTTLLEPVRRDDAVASARRAIAGWRGRLLPVALVVAATLAYVALLITVFDARTWWGHAITPIAAAYAVPFTIVLAVFWRRVDERRTWVAFVATSYAVMVLVTWLPRQLVLDLPELGQLTWWAACAIALYTVPACIYARLHGQSIRSYGLRLGAFAGELWIFALVLPPILVGAWFASSQPRFQATYPFFRGWPEGGAGFGEMLMWWGMYAATFVALEFFFRGFMVAAGHRLIGWWAIPVMAAPYCMLHIDKPLPEMVTSLFGGLLLGFIALRTRSILAGVLAHVTLAIGTDIAVLGHTRI